MRRKVVVEVMMICDDNDDKYCEDDSGHGSLACKKFK
jgi:hypothetical protein